MRTRSLQLGRLRNLLPDRAHQTAYQRTPQNKARGPNQYTEPMKTKDKIFITIIGVLIILAFNQSMTAKAAYNPAPPHLAAAAKRRIPPPPGTTKKRAWVICQVFQGRYCLQALNVAWCESKLELHARNGTYYGIWQFGTYEQRHFNYGKTAWSQTIAAKRYFNIAGWSPWECKPF